MVPAPKRELLTELFVYPIERYIPPVAKVEDTTAATVESDLREYVVTTPIEQALGEFLEVYTTSRTVPTDQIGVWISGFFGAGKSHFAKILNYLLANPTVAGRPAQELFLERLTGSPRRGEIEGLLHRVKLLDSRVVMFDIKTEQDQHAKDESISQIIYRRYLAGRGLSPSPIVARLELALIKRGLYEAFQHEIQQRTGNPWPQERDDFLFIRPTVAEALQAVAPQEYRSREEALAALEMVRQGQQLTVSDLARELTGYVDELARAKTPAGAAGPERPPRLVFIIDEVGQFVGTDSQKLLELQSVAHQFAVQGRGRLWLIITAQARLHELISGVKQLEEEFGKIGARFDTRLALSSEDVERVLEGRILQKKPERGPEIETFYQQHGGTLAALATLPGSSRDLPAMGPAQFTALTPLLPYHPLLIQSIFASVRGATVTGFALNPEVRSMIGAVQGILRRPENGFVQGALGRLVAVDMVYDQIAVDLQHQDRREIDEVAERLSGYRPLDQRVLKALYLLQSVPWIAVTSATLAHALLRDVHTENLGTLQAEIEDSLKRLHEARYIVPKGDGAWEFLTGVKKGFEKDAAGITVRQLDLRRTCRGTLAEILRPLGKLNYRDGLRSFDVAIRGDGEDLTRDADLVLEVYSPLHVELEEVRLADLEQVESFSHPETVYWVGAPAPDLAAHLTRLIRLDEILERWQAKPSKTDDEREIIREKETERNTLQAKVESVLRVALANGTVVWNGRAEELDGQATTLNPIFNRCLAQLVPYVYPRFDMAAVKVTEEDIRATLTTAPYALQTVGGTLDLFDKDGHLNQHCAVVTEVRQELEQRTNRGADRTGKALEEHFGAAPYGWQPLVIRLVLAAMFRAGIVSAKADNIHFTDYSASTAQANFTRTNAFRKAVLLYELAEAVAPGELRRAQDELKVIFGTPRKEETANVLAEQIATELSTWNDRAERLVLQLRPADYPLPQVLLTSQDSCARVTRHPNNPGKVVKAFLEHLEAVRDWHATVEVLYNFVRDKRLPVYQRARRLLDEITRAADVPGTAPLAAADAQGWREVLAELSAAGRAAGEWEQFTAALAPLEKRFQEVYTALHTQRDGALQEARQKLASAQALGAVALAVYECAGLKWDGDRLCCGNCSAPLRELYLQRVALPNLARELKDRHVTDVKYGEEAPRIARLRVSEVVPKRQIANEADLDEMVTVLRNKVTEALGDSDVVELV